MQQVSRDKSLKIPKRIETNIKTINNIEDAIAIKKAVAIANNKKFDKEKVEKAFEERDKELEQIIKIPENANDLMVITIMKKLGAYVVSVTEKSPAKFRGVFVNRMQNFCLDTLEYLLQVNFIRLDSEVNKNKREEYQKEAIIKLKMLGYIAMISENAGCILFRQYKQISIQIGETIKLITAWKKSDDDRWRKR